ncbi:MAG: hypothetical protein EXS16_02250 [Gemmataceae bacterium]|nr:hypothetical protein [Gemmataceae bacterium]
MYKYLLNSGNTYLIVSPRWADLGPAVQWSLLAGLLIVPLTLMVALYRYELRLVARRHAAGLLALRLAVAVVIWLAVAWRPYLADVRTEETPSRVRIAIDLSTSMDVADLQRGDDEKTALAKALGVERIDSTWTRKRIAHHLLSSSGPDLYQRLADRHAVEIVGFDSTSRPLSLDGVLAQLHEAPIPGAVPAATDLNQPLAHLSRGTEQPLLGVIVVTDARHNVGASPLDRADALGKSGVPIFPVIVGSREQPIDWMIVDVQAPTRVFKNTTAPIEIRAKATNLSAQDLMIELQFTGKPMLPEHRQIISHRGKDEVYTARFQAKLEETGTHEYQVRVTSKDAREITLANNTVNRFVRIIEDKAKILLVDGEARWEYHYLASALARDPAVALDRVVFAPPRLGLIKDDLRDKAGLPKTKLPEFAGKKDERDPLMSYDCILLGDVAPDSLSAADSQRLERYVSQRGGTLILIAGKRHMPMDYVKSAGPIGKLLPIIEPRVLATDKGFTLAPTAESKLRPFLQLEPDASMSDWPELPSHYWGVVGKRKPGATVLMTPIQVDVLDAPKEDTGIFVQQNYGFGRVVFLGIDSTWRWRFRVGDTYHHRFWGQLARWSAADQLLPAGNHLIRYGPREPIYYQGQEVEIAVRPGDSLATLKEPLDARAKIFRKRPGQVDELIAVAPLATNTRQGNIIEAKLRDLPPGVYRVELDIPAWREAIAAPNDPTTPAMKDGDIFRVLPRDNDELLDLATDWSLAQSLADRSDGKVYTPETIDDLLERLARRVERTERRDEYRPWRDAPYVWWLLGLLLTLLTTEWIWRKSLELP